jgi:glycosyltransferase involved in cell wall biosynthesis
MLSIIIPTLNEEKYLPLLLKSIKRQRFSGYEIIVSDAGSSDNTLSIARAFGCRITKGGNPARGRNEGAKIARGDKFLFFDADNIYLPNFFLEKLLVEFEKRKLDIASFPIYPQGNGFDKFAYKIYNWWVEKVQNFFPYATNSILVRREIHEKINGFDEEITIGEDHDYAKRGAKVGKFGYIKTEPVLTSTRRFERDGRLKTYSTYLLAGAYMALFGPIKKDIFKYRLNNKK